MLRAIPDGGGFPAKVVRGGHPREPRRFQEVSPLNDSVFLRVLSRSVIPLVTFHLFHRQGIRLCIIGDATKLPPSLQQLAAEAAEATKDNAVIELLVAVSYSGRSDIVQACQKIAQRVRDGTLEPHEITEAVIEEELVTNCTINSPYPDLLIRTSGELRLSNFLLWQSAYSELYFSKLLWPDFGEAEYIDALSSYQQRQRRFGLRT